MKFAVLNPGGNDPEQHFPDFAGEPAERGHAPVNFHAFAACMGGGLYRQAGAIPTETRAVLVLLRHDLSSGLKALGELRRTGMVVVIAWKEAGAFQVAAQLAQPRKLRLFSELCAQAAGALATTPDLGPVFRAAGAHEVAFVPAPYPVDDPRWDFSVPAEQRRGIFLGTREFDVPSRNHATALLCARQLAEARQEPVTVCNVAGWRGRRVLAALGFPAGLLRVVEGRLPYPRYLRLMAEHRLVLQLDASAVPGQVAGDALLCRVPCVGGNGATERLVFPQLCGHGRATEELLGLAARLLDSPVEREAAVERALTLARQQLSFAAVAAQLEAFFARLGA